MSYNENVDGRRKSDPLKTLQTSPARAPDWQLNRVASELDADFTKRSDGVNAGGYNAVRFAVTPMASDPSKDPAALTGGAANPSIEIRVWSEQAEAFVPMPGPLARAGAGAGEPYVFDVPNANGSIVGAFVTNDIAGEFVAISAQGYEIGGSVANAATLTLDTSTPIPVTVEPNDPPHQSGSGGALVAQAQARATPCTLKVVAGYNADSVLRYVQLHNKATALVLGDVPVMIIPVAGGRTAFSLEMELVFSIGFSIGISTTELTYTSAGNVLSYISLVEA